MSKKGRGWRNNQPQQAQDMTAAPVFQTTEKSRTINMADNQSLFFSSNGSSREFGSVLREVQEYISSKYSTLIVDGGSDEVKAHINGSGCSARRPIKPTS